MNIKFKSRYGNANDPINLKLSNITEDFIPFFLINMNPRDSYSWLNPSGLEMSRPSYKSSNPSVLSKIYHYISTYNSDLNECKSELDNFISPRIIKGYYFNSCSILKNKIIDYFHNNQTHEYNDIISIFPLHGRGPYDYALNQGLISTIKNNGNSYKLGIPLVMLMIKKEYVPVLKLQILLNKPLNFEHFEVWVSDYIFSLPEADQKVFQKEIFGKFDSRLSVKWKSNMEFLCSEYKPPVLESLSEKKEWLINQELLLRNKLYGESNVIKTYQSEEVSEIIMESNHPNLVPKPKKVVVELID